MGKFKGDIKPIDMDNGEFFDHYEDNSAVYDDYRDVIDNIGKEDFRAVCLINRDKIINNDEEESIAFCRTAYIKFFDVSEYQPTPMPEFLIANDRKYFIELLEFYHFDYIDFFTNLFIEMDLTLDEVVNPRFIKETFLKNKNKILIIADKVSKVYSYNWILSQFLVTYNKDKIIDWMIKSITADKSLMVMELSNLMEN